MVHCVSKENFSYLSSYNSLSVPRVVVRDNIIRTMAIDKMILQKPSEFLALIDNAKKASNDMVTVLDKLLNEEKAKRKK